MRKSKLEMLDTILQAMIDRQGITETAPGSVARTFVEILVEEFYPFYEELDAITINTYISTATGTYLDLIGELLNCARLQGESDTDYRARIVNQIFVVAGATETALRIKLLTIEGIADVEFVRFTHGAGSFTCYVTPSVYPLQKTILFEAQKMVEAVEAQGVYGEVKTATATPVDVSVSLIFNSSTTNPERQTIRQNVAASVERYINNLGMGGTLIINELIEQIMGTSPKILDLQIANIAVSNVNQYIRNLYPKTEEQYFLNKINVQ